METIGLIISIIVGVFAIGKAIRYYTMQAVQKIQADYQAKLDQDFDKCNLDRVTALLEANTDGTLALLRYRLREETRDAIQRGYTNLTEIETMTGMMEAYRKLSGNGIIERLYREYEDLPVEKEKEN